MNLSTKEKQTHRHREQTCGCQGGEGGSGKDWELGTHRCKLLTFILFCFVLFYFILFYLLFRAVPTAYGGFQARGRTRAVAAGLHHNHSNAGSLTHWARTGIEPASSWTLVRFVYAEPQQELLQYLTSFWQHSKMSSNALKGCLKIGLERRQTIHK